ncbi:hypothetical protein [Streptomyces violarus]|uniref:Uncharacterized protein n=1 Tax=Streptomyces violarus TaxID=67380 RepID=A0A7W4ZN57_9ACTN|nr:MULTISPECIES: hypothetical protein [Streptomyces]MBB3075553.1 hypothetical protein [Streptomyces violarus]WRT98149.1 hypothetical protein VJ737_10830 [Streptomyces sp. CGMCC 4.1772]
MSPHRRLRMTFHRPSRSLHSHTLPASSTLWDGAPGSGAGSYAVAGWDGAGVAVRVGGRDGVGSGVADRVGGCVDAQRARCAAWAGLGVAFPLRAPALRLQRLWL